MGTIEPATSCAETRAGFFYFLGREDDMFVCNGENVYAEEVERRIESMPEIAQACVVPIEDEVRGHMPVAWVVPVRGASPNEAGVKRYAIENGPAYEHPRRVFFLAELPLGGTNKIDRRQLAARAARVMADGFDRLERPAPGRSRSAPSPSPTATASSMPSTSSTPGEKHE